MHFWIIIQSNYHWIYDHSRINLWSSLVFSLFTCTKFNIFLFSYILYHIIYYDIFAFFPHFSKKKYNIFLYIFFSNIWFVSNGGVDTMKPMKTHTHWRVHIICNTNFVLLYFFLKWFCYRLMWSILSALTNCSAHYIIKR